MSVLIALLSIPGYPGAESSADYAIEVYLSPDSSTIQGSLDITFTSGVHFPVDTLWLHLYPNAYSDPTTAFGQDLDAQGSFGFRRSSESDRGWIDLSNWTMNGEPVTIHEDGTLGWIVLQSPLPGGESVSLSGEFAVKVPKFWSRMGQHGDTYQITQWYPKMCVLDTQGWHRSRYHAAGEFYSDYGNYSVVIDVPSDFITAATGRVLETEFNPDSTRRIDHWTAEGVQVRITRLEIMSSTILTAVEQSEYTWFFLMTMRITGKTFLRQLIQRWHIMVNGTCLIRTTISGLLIRLFPRAGGWSTRSLFLLLMKFQ